MLTSRLDRLKSERATASGRPVGGVSGYVRAHLDEIIAAHGELGWDAIAEAISEEGVAWRTGKPISGQDLRVLVCRLRPRGQAEAERGTIALPAPRAETIPLARPTPARVHSAPAKAIAPKPAAIPLSKILGEMRRATVERN